MPQELLVASAHGVYDHYSLMLEVSGEIHLAVYIQDITHNTNSEYSHIGTIKYQSDNSYIYELASLLNKYPEFQVGEPFVHPDQFILDVQNVIPFEVYEERLLRLAWSKFGFLDFYLRLSYELLEGLFNQYGSLYHYKIYSVAKQVSQDNTIWNRFNSAEKIYYEWDKVINLLE